MLMVEGAATNVIFSQNMREGIAPAVVHKLGIISEILVRKSDEML
jgi:hypothetical protein